MLHPLSCHGWSVIMTNLGSCIKVLVKRLLFSSETKSALLGQKLQRDSGGPFTPAHKVHLVILLSVPCTYTDSHSGTFCWFFLFCQCSIPLTWAPKIIPLFVSWSKEVSCVWLRRIQLLSKLPALWSIPSASPGLPRYRGAAPLCLFTSIQLFSGCKSRCLSN